MVVVGAGLGLWLGSGSVLAQAGDPALDPAYQPDPAATTPAQQPSQQPAQTPAQNPGSQPVVVTPNTGAPAQPNQVHPATVTTPVDPDDKVLVAPPPGWQLARPVYLNGRLYYAVHDAQAYLDQAGWTQAAVVHLKSQTGFRFDLILVPRSRAAGVTVRTIARNGSGLAIDTGLGVRTGYGRVFDPWIWGRGYVSSGAGRYTGPIDGQLSPGYSPPIPEPEPVVLTLMEEAGLELGFGEAERAITLYSQHLDADPEDMAAVRGLGVALVAVGRGEDAAATIRYAYVTDPALAGEPLGAWIAGDDARDLRRLVTDAVKHANRNDSASAWLTVAVLMQAEGRLAVALKMLDRAEERGLDLEVARAMRGALTQR
ncbi:MAG: hypothetical protein DHS20C14_05860 [Phycisphaeraceae bacterium]|nr:MAG: hypothetical protein DHS20C14_05860 [Phycisphaeraceae bacterium]